MEFWKRKEATMQYRWDLTDFHSEEVSIVIDFGKIIFVQNFSRKVFHVCLELSIFTVFIKSSSVMSSEFLVVCMLYYNLGMVFQGGSIVDADTV